MKDLTTGNFLCPHIQNIAKSAKIPTKVSQELAHTWQGFQENAWVQMSMFWQAKAYKLCLQAHC